MPKTHPIFDRYWSLAAAILLPVIELSCEGLIRLFMDYEVARAVLAVVSIALLVHSWLLQRKHTTNRWRLGFFTLLLSLVALGPVWLELNVFRYYAHPMNWNKWELWQAICEWQYRVEQLAQILVVGVALWVTVDLVRWRVKRGLGKLP